MFAINETTRKPTNLVTKTLTDRLLTSSVELEAPAVARQLAAGAASADTALTVGCARLSMRATGADIRYAVGSSAQTSSATSHFIAAGERLYITLPTTPHIAVIRNAAIDGVLEVSELV